MSDQEFVLEVQNLKKHFGQVKAVDGINLSIKRGLCFGLLGPNGAGKTTTVEMIEAVTKPSSGLILYKGKPLGDHYREEIGIQFQKTSFKTF